MSDKGGQVSGCVPSARQCAVKCVVCRGIIHPSQKKTREHIYPKAIYKWGEQFWNSRDYNRYFRLIECSNNIGYSHNDCNIEKAENIPDLSMLMLTKSKLKKLLTLKEELYPAIITFSELKERILKKQDMKCFRCGKPLSGQNDGVIRRIVKEKQRIESNACIVCDACSIVLRAVY